MKKDIVLHSDCPFLLMRMFTDLQMDGRFDDDIYWNNNRNPFIQNEVINANYLHIDSGALLFLSFEGDSNEVNIPLTESNYLETLKMILE